ncbi:cytochrome c biogenesis protein ResB [Antrihabitans spumae]|uniref:Cytochrome c biogenesis protein ResB n=1 Tax=Antrihabitans spumae TaxID=3373370 RepID=A0ABW7KU51_9NOCA
MTAIKASPTRAPRPNVVRTVAATVRNTWRQLTSMRTALVLLFLLALAAVPGAVLPQRNLNTQKVSAYIAARPTLGPAMDKLQLFDVFSSFWFTSVYALLFISLVGCLGPRVVDHAKALRADPVAAPRNLSRLPHHRTGSVDVAQQEIAARVAVSLRRWRVITRVENDGVTTVSAERGYLREAGNLAFHLSLIGMLVSIAVGKMFGYEGSVIVIADNGPGFCNTSPAVYDSFQAGNSIDGTGLRPLCVRVKDFEATYLPNGQAEMFTSNISFQAGADLATNSWQDFQLRVNNPLRVGGERVYLTGHGYAPQFTVTFPDGQTRTEAIQFAPNDATTFLSSGALRFDPPGGTYKTDEERRRNQIAIEGLFAPTAKFNGTLLASIFPEMLEPAVAVDIYKGDTGLDSGIPQSIFGLNKELIDRKQLVRQDRVNLRSGESATLADGTNVRFDGAKEFVNLKISHDPAQLWVLVSAITLISGLVVSLAVPRRRVWLRVYPQDVEAFVVVEVGGLARTDQAGWGPEFNKLCDSLFADVIEQPCDEQPRAKHKPQPGTNRA